ncbi:MAG: DUF4391 domain-containing protein [Bacillota bacterium]|nr:DUF4391 domain-containing protein [Bacillota bacterium]
MNLNLPNTALLNKFIPKTKFTQQSFVNTKLKQEFTSTIQKITWLYKISEETTGIPKTDLVEEIQVFELQLKQQIIPKKVIRLIHRSIPYPILYILTYQGQTAYAIVLDTNEQKYEYFTDWNANIDITFSGNNLEKVYNNLVRSFITSIDTNEKPFAEVVSTDLKIKEVCKEIERFESKIKREMQFNKKVGLNQKLLSLKKELAELQKA